MANNLKNISSLVSPSLVSGAASQLASQATSKVKQTILTKVDELKNRLQELIQKRISTEASYKISFQTIQNDPTKTSEEKAKLIDDLQQKRINEINLLNDEIKKIEDEISNSSKDILKPFKKKKKSLNDTIDRSIKTATKNQIKANLLRNAQVLRNTKKTLAPIITNQITNILIKVASQNVKLQELVDKTNEIIDAADTPEKINQAKVLRDNAIAIINNQEQKLKNIKNIIDRLERVLTLIQTIINIIKIVFSIPKPFGPGPTMPTPVAIKVNKLQALVDALGVTASIAKSILEQAYAELEDLKAQLREINALLDGKASNLNSDQLGLLLNNTPTGFPLGLYPVEYKGFKFALREESGPKAIVVRGNKRHYAEAIDTNNVAVLKSELSFTLDPNDLIDQLKLIIDSQNLIA
jgi:hypothetical protein